MINLLRHMALAISFLTITPLPVSGVSPEDIRRSSVFFPLTGWFIGGIMVLLALGLAEACLEPLVGGALLIAFEAWFTRGLHLDGVADLCDGLGGGHEPEKRLAIMKDSATGAFGVVGLVLTLFLKIVGITILLEKELFLYIAFVPAAARWAILVLASISIYPRQRGTGHSFVEKISAREVFFGFCWLLPLMILFPDKWLNILALLIFTLLPAFYLRIRGHQLLGGVTGDLLGASCEFGETLGFIAASALLI